MTDASDVHGFFERYAKTSRDTDPEAIAVMYAPTFLVAGPKGSAAFPNDASFRRWLTELHRFDEEHGMGSLEVVAIDTMRLSPIHELATVTWGARFTKTGDRRIDFRISYLLERSTGGPLILAYVSEADQEEEMKRLGIL